jgi:hypothetical protein
MPVTWQFSTPRPNASLIQENLNVLRQVRVGDKLSECDRGPFAIDKSRARSGPTP